MLPTVLHMTASLEFNRQAISFVSPDISYWYRIPVAPPRKDPIHYQWITLLYLAQYLCNIRIAIAALRYDAHSSVEKVKGGVSIYDGTASRFHEWEFCTALRWEATNAEDEPKTMSMVIKGLRSAQL